MQALAYYVTAHGYGHAARSCDILRAIREQAPDLPVTVISMVDPGFWSARLTQGPFTFRRAAFDVGMKQIDSIRMDIPGSLDALRILHRLREQHAAEEARWLAREGFTTVACDLPSTPFEAAHRAGLRSTGIGNFSWDWIYESFILGDPAWSDIVESVRTDSARADQLVRLPFSEPMRAFRRPVDVPLVARPGEPRRTWLARTYGCDPGKRWALLSFTQLDWDAEALKRAARVRDTIFFTMQPLRWDLPGWVALERTAIPFADLVASVDVVVTKPGYGILSECVVNRKPIIYADRADFREYDVLVDGIRRHLQHVHLPSEHLYRGELAGALESIQTAPQPTVALASDGGRAAARAILELARG